MEIWRLFISTSTDFRFVNESLGHEAGDYMLSVVAKRLKGILEDKHLISRLSGDEFALLLKEIRDALHAEELMQEVQQYLEEPIEVMGQHAYPIRSA